MPPATARGRRGQLRPRSHGRKLDGARPHGDAKFTGAPFALGPVLRAVDAPHGPVGDAVGEPHLVAPEDAEEAVLAEAEGALALPRFDDDVLGDREVAAAAAAEIARRGASQLARGMLGGDDPAARGETPEQRVRAPPDRGRGGVYGLG